jgi:hypothetical protein
VTTHIKEEKFQVPALADLTAASAMHHAIGLISGTITPTALAAIGVLKSNALSGNNVAVCYWGITKVAVGAAVSTAGYPITVTTSGWFVAATSGQFSIGRSLSTATSGDIMAAMVDFMNPNQLATI